MEIACGNMSRPVGDDRDSLSRLVDERGDFTAENGGCKAQRVTVRRIAKYTHPVGRRQYFIP